MLVSNTINTVLKTVARKRKKEPRPVRYYCKALGGESLYNICINSDLSVSCNCQDYDGSGQIGSLRTDTLQEIFDGPVARKFRKLLAKGILPVQTCANCAELAEVPKRQAREKARSYTVPRLGIMVENTVVCNLECLACDRSVVDVRKSAKGAPGGRVMSLNDVEIAAKAIRDNRIEQVCYHNLGEPFLSKRILAEMRLMRDINPDARFIVSTNGMFIDREDKQEAALLFDHIMFSIDGSSQATVEKYQIHGNFRKAYKCMRDLVALRDARFLKKPLIEWKYVVFAWNDSREEIETAIDMARDAKIDIISFQKGSMPTLQGMSERYGSDPFFLNLGAASWRGREIVLRKDIPIM